MRGAPVWTPNPPAGVRYTDRSALPGQRASSGCASRVRGRFRNAQSEIRFLLLLLLFRTFRERLQGRTAAHAPQKGARSRNAPRGDRREYKKPRTARCSPPHARSAASER
eukprot:scaffold7203_cov416-Prasinococcus_capsulatus_cf.AAC.11